MELIALLCARSKSRSKTDCGTASDVPEVVDRAVKDEEILRNWRSRRCTGM
ncbi:hypothetical protein ACNKHM_09130 [Shigella sonnei]